MAKTPTKLPKQEPKNPVAKNASAAIGGGAAGRMVNKAKRDSSGATRGQKHKNKAMELSEGLPNDAETQVTELSRDTLKSYVPKRIEKIQSIPNQKTPRKEFKKLHRMLKKIFLGQCQNSKIRHTVNKNLAVLQKVKMFTSNH